MKTQNTPKLAKKTVFVYKNVKTKDSYATHPTGDMSHSVATSLLVNI